MSEPEKIRGAYFDVPDFLNTRHAINNAADAEAYLSRLQQFATLRHS